MQLEIQTLACDRHYNVCHFNEYTYLLTYNITVIYSNKNIAT